MLTPPTREPWQTSPVHADGARPTSRAEVNELVAIALRPLLGQVDRTDEGDVVLTHLDGYIWVRASAHMLLIRLCCTLDHHQGDLDEAARIALRLNDTVHGAKFKVFDDESFLVMIDMIATPFVPEHLRDHVQHLFALIANWEDEVLPEARRQETP